MINTSYAYKLKYRIFKAQHYAPWKNTHLVDQSGHATI